MKHICLLLLGFVTSSIFSQSFIQELKPVYWEKPSDMANEEKNLNYYKSLIDLKDVVVRTKNLTVFIVANCQEEDLNTLILSENNSVRLVDESKSSLHQGVIYTTTLHQYRKKNLVLPLSKSDFKIYEVLIFDKVIEKESKAKIETYLSIKYGVSLSTNENYINTFEDVMWDNAEVQEFSTHVTGVGVFKTLDFIQLRSKNSESEDFEILFEPVDQHSEKYLLWGNNNLKNEEKVWYLKHHNLSENDRFTFSFTIFSDEDFVVLLSEDKDFRAPVTYVPLRKDGQRFVSAAVNLKSYSYLKLQKTLEIEAFDDDLSDTANQWIIYPNPNEGNFFIDFNFENEQEVDCVIYDSVGKRVKEIKLGKFSKHLQVFEEDLPTGIYFITVKMDNNIKTKKLIVKQ